MAVTENKQEPFTYGALGGRAVYLVPPADNLASQPTSLPKLDTAAQVWAVTQNSTSPEVLKTFIDRFKGTIFADLASARLREIEQKQAALVPAPENSKTQATSEPTPTVTSKQSALVPPSIIEPQKEDCGDKMLVKVGGNDKCLQPGDSFRDCPNCPEMVVVPAGSFIMGSPVYERGRHGDEGPQHRVKFEQTFAVGKFEVTFSEWDACLADDGCKNWHPQNENWGRGEHPVIYISWFEAKAYVQWLSKRTGEKYRLLSEAEWEYVARGGTTTPFSTGKIITPDQANFKGSYVRDGIYTAIYLQKTVPVGAYSANNFGLYDMYGNVLEWVEDCYYNNYRGAPNDGSVRTSGDCASRIQRGGSWQDTLMNLRSANRVGVSPLMKTSKAGFRVARATWSSTLPLSVPPPPNDQAQRQQPLTRHKQVYDRIVGDDTLVQ